MGVDSGRGHTVPVALRVDLTDLGPMSRRHPEEDEMDQKESQNEQEVATESHKWNVAAGVGVGGLFAPFAGLGAWVMDLELFGVVGIALAGGALLGTFVASPST